MSKLIDAIAQLAGKPVAELQQMERAGLAAITQAGDERDATHAQIVRELAADLMHPESRQTADVEYHAGRMAEADELMKRKQSAARWQYNVAMNARRDAQEGGK